MTQSQIVCYKLIAYVFIETALQTAPCLRQISLEILKYSLDSSSLADQKASLLFYVSVRSLLQVPF